MATSTRALIALGIAIASLAVRAPTLDRALTIDEKLWIERSDRFVDAFGDLRFGDAIETGHPGVTTMWVAGLAQRTLPAGADLRDRYERARLGMGIATTGLVVLIWWLAGLIFGGAVGALAGFLLALDPFLVAHGRVVHLDGLLALLMVASVLALMAALRDDDRRMLLLSGALGGLSLLTKQPAVYLILVAAVLLWRDGGGIRARLLRWLIPAAVVVFVLWPVLWVRPWHAAGQMLGGGGAAVTETTSSGFFLGRQVDDPGPQFYPVALALRSSELILPAAIGAIVWAVRRRREDPGRSAVRLLLFALGFLVLMSIAPKKGDRYGLPSLVAVDLVVAVALWQLFRSKARVVVGSALAAMLSLHAAPALWLHPYELAHFNLVTGGASVAQRAVVVGWGEGLDEAAEGLSRMPGASGMTVATTRVTQFEDFFIGRTIRVEDSSLARPDGTPADLVLFYISSVQTGRVPTIWARYRDRAPVYRLDINGIPYVRVYRVTE
ncbi:MAG: ArnT family glycosyltransferase [Actinomycetota bacterium]